ncbi:efflux RND transporter periplasmic adaptor subunit [Paenibacillus sp. TRM 82003]|nr:efflux RND transporter periplasmic adaptor subunit [Paenibacillus sp. TRM 82003]
MKSARAVSFVLAISVLSAVVVGCSMEEPSEEQAQEKVTPVQVAKVAKGDLTLQSELIGSALPGADVTVVPKMSGELAELSVDKNQVVERGDVLGRIDGANLSIQLEMERLALEQAQNQYKDAYNAGAPQAQLDQAKNGVRQAQLRVELAELNAKNTVIEAPIGGKVIEVGAEPGEMVGPSSVFARIVDLDPIRIVASVSTNQMLAMLGKAEAEVQLPDLGETATAKITYLSSVADGSGFYTLEAELANPEERIKPGMLAKFLLESELVGDAVLVPTSAIVEKGGSTYVFLIKDGRAVETTVTVLQTQSDLSAVEGEIAENDSIVTKGQFTLSDGNLVNIVEEAAN